MKKALYVFLIIIQFVSAVQHVPAGTRFSSSYSCSDAIKTCTSSGIRKVDGFDVHRDCWEWAYTKTCNYPSKNDCRLYEHCYAVANLECLLKDTIGNCVNLKREFSCKSWEKSTKEDKLARVDLIAKDGEDSLVCKGIPCIDGNCVDKSYLTNGEMMDSVSKLYMASNMKPDADYNFNLFPGFASHCSKKAAGYSNCCPDTPKGWGKQLGAKCTKDEQSLMSLRSKNLCIYVGKENKQKMGVKTIVKHHFCCFGNMLEKVVQVEGRKQLGINFGSGGSTNCRGLTLDEIQRLDFSQMDFSEFISELVTKFAGTYKTPNPKEIANSIENHLNIRKYDDNENNPDNRFTGLNGNIKDDSWEAEEERKIEAERLRLAREEEARLTAENARKIEEARQAELKRQQEETRLAQVRAAEEERARLARAEEAKRLRRTAKERELADAWRKTDNYWKIYVAWRSNLPIPSNVLSLTGKYKMYLPEYERLMEPYRKAFEEYKRIEAGLKNGNY